jgi:hypothetical protein
VTPPPPSHRCLTETQAIGFTNWCNITMFRVLMERHSNARDREGWSGKAAGWVRGRRARGPSGPTFAGCSRPRRGAFQPCTPLHKPHQPASHSSSSQTTSASHTSPSTARHSSSHRNRTPPTRHGVRPLRHTVRLDGPVLLCQRERWVVALEVATDHRPLSQLTQA